MKAKRPYGLPTGRAAVTIGYVAIVVTGFIYLKKEGCIDPSDISSIEIAIILGVLSSALLSSIGSLVFSRAPTFKERAKVAARAAGWGALAAGGFILMVILAFGAIGGLLWAWGERSQ